MERYEKFHSNGAEYYYVRNAQNDIIGLIDDNGQMVVKYNYDTWGKLLTIEGSLKDSLGVKNPYRYRGYRYDTETGLYYLNARYYNADWGRFINADDLGGEVGTLLSHNAFAYCFNNPVNMDDPSGHFPKWIGAAFEVVAGAAMKIAGGMAIYSGVGILVGIALLVYGGNHVNSAVKDLYNISQGNDEEVGKNNIIRNQMEEAYGEEAGEVIYEICDLGVAITTFKPPTPTNIAKMSSFTLENYAFKTASNNITSYTGINGVRNIFSRGYNVSMIAIASTGNKIKDYANRIIKIFEGEE